MNEITGVTKWKYQPMLYVPAATFRVGAIWDLAYFETAQYVLKALWAAS